MGSRPVILLLSDQIAGRSSKYEDYRRQYGRHSVFMYKSPEVHDIFLSYRVPPSLKQFHAVKGYESLFWVAI